ncbi:MAG: aminopeptidase [Fulvivirga sp.]
MRQIAYFFLTILIALIFHNASLISYGVGQAVGQLKIVWNAQPIEKYLQQESVPDSLRQKLVFIEKVRHYAVNELGLNDSENYTTIYDQKGEPLLWVVTGCKPFSFEAKQWKFPVLGSVPYKGFFDLDKASKELARVKDEGYDAGIRTVGGWSTLGWFNDPILSNMLHRSNGSLANLIIHELVHSTVFVKDSVEFNENLASFIADKGAIAFMKNKYGESSDEYTAYLKELNDEKVYVDHILRGVEQLESLYLSINDRPMEEKEEKKRSLIENIMQSTDTLSLYNNNFLTFVKGQVPNNTYFMSFMRYRSKQDQLDSIYSKRYNARVKPFVDYLKNKHPYL